DRAETEAYFAHRPRGSQLGAWASPQSRVVADRSVIDDGFEQTARRFAPDAPVPPPPHWGGLRVEPETVEFWQGRASGLQARVRYRRTDAGTWVVERLGP